MSSKLKLTSSYEVWKYLCSNGGFSESYDLQIIVDICKELEIPYNSNLGRILKKNKISVEKFISAFFKSLEPYAKMMSEIYEFFIIHKIKQTNKHIRIEFDFGEGAKDIHFDIEHFKEGIEKWTKITKDITYYEWSPPKLWRLFDIVKSDFTRRKVTSGNIQEWIDFYDQGKFLDTIPTLRSTEIKDIDVTIHRLLDILQGIMQFTIEFVPDLATLMKLYHEASHDIDNLEDSLTNKQKILHNLMAIHHDRWASGLIVRLFWWIEELLTYPKEQRFEKASSKIEKINEIIKSLPVYNKKETTYEKKIDEVLNLPIWKHRYELYQTWVLALIDKSLDKYKRRIHHDDGVLLLRFSGTHVASVYLNNQTLHLWSELKSPIKFKPLGFGRKHHIQPDYSIRGEPLTSPSKTILTIECKQYKKQNSRNFANVLTDYALGLINSEIILVNYGPLQEKRILEKVDSSILDRVFMIGKLYPENTEPLNVFDKIIHEKISLFNDVQFVAVDVSGSMDEPHKKKLLFDLLISLSEKYAETNLLAVDIKIRGEFELSKDGIEQLFNLPFNFHTQLDDALESINLDHTIVITDEDGWEQIENLPKKTFVINQKIDEYER